GPTGVYYFTLLSGKQALFGNSDTANKCKDNFEHHKEDIRQYMKKAQDIWNDLDVKLERNRQQKSDQLALINKQLAETSGDDRELNEIIKDVSYNRAKEKYLSMKIKPETHANDYAEAKIDWPHVIETNATRIGALATMFFLVTILVPQYRYSMKMADFY